MISTTTTISINVKPPCAETRRAGEVEDARLKTVGTASKASVTQAVNRPKAIRRAVGPADREAENMPREVDAYGTTTTGVATGVAVGAGVAPTLGAIGARAA